ncbi:MAG: cytochrome d ubiquinol oxidase subunit II [Gammaproteobacteria bacterium 28-57-27]|nr:MAG: cytochrome d ubiquinol oxidase subunit II [Gammaproteobacteria bacterium 28-57-27]
MDAFSLDNPHHLLASIWFAIIGLFLIFYVILDGFDLGMGILSLAAPNEQYRGAMMSSIGSIWDANETWLVIVGGTLFGAFPLVYGTVLHGLYIPITLMLLGFIMRGVSFEFYALSSRKKLWGIAFGLGSLLAVIAQGFALGGLLNGIKIENGLFTGDVFDWFSPFSLMVVLGVIAGYSVMGANYMILKFTGELQKHAYARSKIFSGWMLFFAGIVTIWTPLQYPSILERWFTLPNFFAFALLPLAALFCFYMLFRALARCEERAPFIWSLLIFMFSFIGLAASLFPYIVPGAITIDQAAAPTNTLVFMLLGIGMLIPVMIAYNIYQYSVFSGKINPDAPSHHD